MRIYKFMVLVFRFWLALRGYKITGRENLPVEGAVVLMGNHCHWSDPVYMATVYKERQVHFMAKGEFFKNRLLAKFLYHVGSFAVHRGEADVSALRSALGYMRKKEVLGIFPEGTRNKTGKGLLEFKQGATLIAYKGKAVIVPMGIKNSKNFLRFWRSKPEVNIGKPICFEDCAVSEGKNMVDEYTEIAKNSIQSLIDA